MDHQTKGGEVELEKVNYLKLSEQYASFLVAVGGVSITVLTLVLSLGSDSDKPTKANTRSFLVAALVVATVTCFIGAHMMAETAAFIQFHENMQPPVPSGKRLFLLACINIFIAIILVLFALMLLPTSSGKIHSTSIAPISVGVFALTVCGALYWMVLGAYFRMSVPQSGWAIWSPITIAAVLGGVLYFLLTSENFNSLLWVAFAPCAFFTVASLVWFAWIFKDSSTDHLQDALIKDVWFFSLAISLSYMPLVVTGIKIMRCKQQSNAEA